MTKQECIDIFGLSDILELPNAALSVVLGDKERRDKVYEQLLRANNWCMEEDWFQNVYEEDFAERKAKKQDFTPKEVAEICAQIAGTEHGSIHEPTAGTGRMVITAWNRARKSVLPWEFFPSEHQVTCWELSDRAVPLLLLNLSIRGIMGYVYHGDVLENAVKQKYILLNGMDDAMAFSDVVAVGNNAKIVLDDDSR